MTISSITSFNLCVPKDPKDGKDIKKDDQVVLKCTDLFNQKEGQLNRLRSQQFNLRSPIKVHTWDQLGLKIHLYYQPNSGLKAEVIKGSKVFHVSHEWITGIPLSIRKDLGLLSFFIKDTFGRAHLSVDGTYRIQINSRIRGGVGGQLSTNVLNGLKEAIEQAKIAKGKNLIAIIGRSGAGKSCLTNYMLGKEMEEFHQQGDLGDRLQVRDGVEIAPIGHVNNHSKTRFTNVYPTSEKEYFLADCGGFEDTEGPDNEIVVVNSMKMTLENAKNVKFVLCVSESMLHDDRIQGFEVLIGRILEKFFKTRTAIEKSILLMITRPTRKTSLKQIIDFLVKLQSDSLGDKRQVYDFILRDNGKYICISDLTSASFRDDIYKSLESDMLPINLKGGLHVAYAGETNTVLQGALHLIGSKGSLQYREYFNKKDNIGKEIEEILKLTNEKDIINRSIHQFGNENQTLGEIQTKHQTIIEEKAKIFSNQLEEITKLNSSKKELEIHLEAACESLELLQRSVPEEVMHYSVPYEREALIVKVPGPKRPEHKSKTNWLGTTTTWTDWHDTWVDDPRNQTNDFSYQGPKILRLELDPPQSSGCWSNISQDYSTGQFNATYSSGPGLPASARITVYISGVDDPQYIERLNKQKNNISEITKKLNDLLTEIALLESIKTGAEKESMESENVLAQLTILEESLNQYEISIKEKNDNLVVAQEQLLELQEKINGDKSDFTFLTDYLNLTEDQELANNEIIKEFLELHNKYADVM